MDSAAVEPIEEPSWLLDVDAFPGDTRALHVDATVTQARSFAERIYSIFRCEEIPEGRCPTLEP